MRGARLAKRGQAGADFEDLNTPADPGDTGTWDAGSGLGIELARAKANDNLAEALERFGWSTEGAQVIARACVKPDEVRRRLTEPAELRVPGGTMLVVETLVFSHGITVFPTNLRELGNRHYPLGMSNEDAEESVIAEPTSDAEYPCELVLNVGDAGQLSERLRSSEAWLTRQNPLAGDIAAEGVLQPVTLVGMRIDHRNGAPSAHLLTAADGSSRTTATHKILGTDPADLVYGTGASNRQFRQQIGVVLRQVREYGWADLADEERKRVRALTMPARLVIGYRQEPVRGVGFHAAVRSLIGMMHIAPPLRYGQEVERDATADAVLDALRRPHRGQAVRIDDDEARWYAATMSQKQRLAAGLPPHADVRAADITRVLLHGGRRTTLRVNAGIRSITARTSPTADERVAIAVELILRPWRTAHANDPHLNLVARRSALQRAYGMPEIGRQPDEPLLEGFADSEYTLEELRDQAYDEADQGLGRQKGKPLGYAQVELATKAAYYLILAEPMGLRREAPPSRRTGKDGEPVDQRSPSAVLTAMLATRRGVTQAYAIVRDGRKGRPLREVDGTGVFLTDTDGNSVILTDERVRAAYGGRSPRPQATTGLAATEDAWTEFVRTLGPLEKATQKLSRIRSATGRRYLDEEGWPEDEIKPVRERIDLIVHKLRTWEQRWTERRDDEADEELGEQFEETE